MEYFLTLCTSDLMYIDKLVKRNIFYENTMLKTKGRCQHMAKLSGVDFPEGGQVEPTHLTNPAASSLKNPRKAGKCGSYTQYRVVFRVMQEQMPRTQVSEARGLNSQGA